MKFLKPSSLYELVKRSGENSRLLSLHISTDGVGVVVLEAGNTKVEQALTPLECKKGIQFIGNHLKLLIPKYSVKGILTGLPSSYDGRDTLFPTAMEVKDFMNDLDKTGELGDMSYTFWEYDPVKLREELALHERNSRAARMLRDFLDQNSQKQY